MTYVHEANYVYCERDDSHRRGLGVLLVRWSKPRGGECLSTGEKALSRNDFDALICCCNEAIRLDPKDADAYCYRGVAYGDQGEHDNAIADFTEAIRLDPKCAAAYLCRGEA